MLGIMCMAYGISNSRIKKWYLYGMMYSSRPIHSHHGTASASANYISLLLVLDDEDDDDDDDDEHVAIYVWINYY